ncbi:hypothetical protein DPMN_065405 [Dreissena polymorpha]|uniref:Uncharacterized protein n=1 Tax=Dreissena polymorpha TaxID=45954 RepID=A0A9D3YVV2_DREPO|nr:hypothetical protein DPMN_065405 [Dreissena polymorpha]
MPKYANRLPKFEDTDAASGSSETTGKGKRHATKPYTRPEQSASIDLKSFGYQLNRLGRKKQYLDKVWAHFCENCCLMMFDGDCAMCRADVTGWVRMLFTD